MQESSKIKRFLLNLKVETPKKAAKLLNIQYFSLFEVVIDLLFIIAFKK
jgi:hypothetical protein